MKVVINKCFGGFDLSSLGVEYYYRLKGVQEFFYYAPFWDSETKKYKRVDSNTNQKRLCVLVKDFGSDGIIEISSEDFHKYYLSHIDIERTDENLIKTVENLGEEANSEFSNLTIVEIPDDVQWQIEEYDGVEWVAEVHRTWG